MQCRIHHIHAPKDKPVIYAGNTSISIVPNLQMGGLMSLVDTDDGTKVLMNDNLHGMVMTGKGITITSPSPLTVIHIETFVAAYTYRFRQERNDKQEYVASFSVIGTACPEYFSQKQDEMFRIVIVEDGMVSDVCVLKGGRYRIYPKGPYVDWLSDEKNARLLGNHPKLDIPVKKDNWNFEQWVPTKKYIFAYSSEITPEEIQDRFGLSLEIDDIKVSMHPIDVIIDRITSGDTRVNPKNVVIVGRDMSEIWRMRFDFDTAIDQYLMKKAQ